MPTFTVLSSWQSHCESSFGSFDECRTPTIAIYYYYSARKLILILATALDVLHTSLFAQNEQHIKTNNKKATTNNKADRH